MELVRYITWNFTIDLNAFINRPGFNSSNRLNKYFILQNSKFDIYLESKFIDQDQCNEHLTYSFDRTIFTEFSNLFLNDDVHYAYEICPFVFKNADLTSLTVKNQNFILKNMFRFRNVLKEEYQLNSSIISFDVSGYRYDINKALLNKQVFENLVNFLAKGNLNAIQSGVFWSLKSLLSIRILNENFGNFFHKIGIEWTRELNAFLKEEITPQNIKWNLQSRFLVGIFVLIEDSGLLYKQYSYSDEDFCIFALFPHEKLILPILNNSVKACSCTLLWLLQVFFFECQSI